MQESFDRVTALLQSKDKEIRLLSKYLYEHDYLSYDEMDKILTGKNLGTEKEENRVRSWDKEKNGNYLIQFWGSVSPQQTRQTELGGKGW